MKRRDYQVSVLATVVVVMVAFLSTLLLVNADFAFAAMNQKKSTAAVRPSAIAYTETQIKQLEGALKIADAQKELWNNVTQVMRENAKEMEAFADSRAQERAENTKRMNAVERMKFHSKITKAQLDQLEKLLPPFEALYASMSEQQKNITDILFETGRRGKSKKR